MTFIDKLQITLEPFHHAHNTLLRVEVVHGGQIMTKDQVFRTDDFESTFERLMEYATCVIKQKIKEDRKTEQHEEKSCSETRGFTLTTKETR